MPEDRDTEERWLHGANYEPDLPEYDGDVIIMEEARRCLTCESLDHRECGEDDDAPVEVDLDSIPSSRCPACGCHEAVNLGDLGSATWARCRACAFDYIVED